MGGTRADIGPEQTARRRPGGLAAAFVCGLLYGLATAAVGYVPRYGGGSPAMSALAAVAMVTLVGLVLLIPFGIVAWRRSRSQWLTGGALALVVIGFVMGVAAVVNLARPSGGPYERPGIASVEPKDGGAPVWSGRVACLISQQRGAPSVLSISGIDAPLQGGDALDEEIAARGIDDPDGLLDRVRLVSIRPDRYTPPHVGIVDENRRPDQDIGFLATSLGVSVDGWAGRAGFDRLDPAVVITWTCERG